MKPSWKVYFAFNRRERRGVLILSFLNLSALVLLVYKEQLFPTRMPALVAQRYKVEVPPAPQKGIHETLKKKNAPPALSLLELNAADSVALTTLKGIGPSFARRIIRYRARLGGFRNISQLMEVYGMDRERFELLKKQVALDTTLISLLNINTLPADTLKEHPYVRWKLANLIVNYRAKHGPYLSVPDLRKLDLVTDSIYSKLAPYCTVK